MPTTPWVADICSYQGWRFVSVMAHASEEIRSVPPCGQGKLAASVQLRGAPVCLYEGAENRVDIKLNVKKGGGTMRQTISGCDLELLRCR